MVARRTSAGRMLFFQVKRTWVTRVTGFWHKLDEIFHKLWKRSRPFLLTSAQAVRDGVRNTDFQITLGIPKLAGEKSCCHGGYLAARFQKGFPRAIDHLRRGLGSSALLWLDWWPKEGTGGT